MKVSILLFFALYSLTYKAQTSGSLDSKSGSYDYADNRSPLSETPIETEILIEDINSSSFQNCLTVNREYIPSGDDRLGKCRGWCEITITNRCNQKAYITISIAAYDNWQKKWVWDAGDVCINPGDSDSFRACSSNGQYSTKIKKWGNCDW